MTATPSPHPSPAPTPQRWRTRWSHPCTGGCDNGFFDGEQEGTVIKCQHCNGSGIEPEAATTAPAPRRKRNPLEHLTPEQRARILPYADN